MQYVMYSRVFGADVNMFPYTRAYVVYARLMAEGCHSSEGKGEASALQVYTYHTQWRLAVKANNALRTRSVQYALQDKVLRGVKSSIPDCLVNWTIFCSNVYTECGLYRCRTFGDS